MLTSKDANLTKAHVRYLESRFITLAQQARRSRLVNGTAPPPLPLPEADVSDMEYFIAQAAIMLPVLGINILRSAAAAASYPTGSAPGTVDKPKALIKPAETTCHKPAEQRGNITPPELFAVLADASVKSRTRWGPSLRVASGPSAFTIATGG